MGGIASRCGFQVGGRRVMLVNNNADQTGTGIRVTDGDGRAASSTTACFAPTHDALVLGDKVASALVLNNVLQGDEHNLVVDSPAAGRGRSGWTTTCTRGRRCRSSSTATRRPASSTTWRPGPRPRGWDRNSRVAPLVYFKQQDRNGRWRVREACISVTNVTPHFNVGPLGANAYPYAGGGTYILDLPQNWKPHGDPARRVYVFDVQPSKAPWPRAPTGTWPASTTGATTAAARSRICTASTSPPEQMPAGSFCQDVATGRVYVRLPADAQEPCPIGQHLKLSPRRRSATTSAARSPGRRRSIAAN